jgi:hypothetical protein
MATILATKVLCSIDAGFAVQYVFDSDCSERQNNIGDVGAMQLLDWRNTTGH